MIASKYRFSLELLEDRSLMAGAGSSTQTAKLFLPELIVAPPTVEQAKPLAKAAKLRVLDDLFAKWD